MKVVIAAGGSGGHIFPAIALANELRDQERADIVFVASERELDKKILNQTAFKTYFMTINPMPFKLGPSVVPFIINLFKDMSATIAVLKQEKPDVVVGFGGYTSGATLFFASLLGIKTVIHEQNVVPGRANKMLDRFVDCVAVSFDDSKECFKNKNVVLTGNPLRKSMCSGSREEAYKALGLQSGKFNILVIGGSQGARTLNSLASSALSNLESELTDRIQVIHIAGNNGLEEVSKVYSDKRIDAKIYSFLDDIHHAYNACDLAITRSGAAAIFELSLYGRPMILVPYPSKKNSQRLNARYFERKGAAICMEEENSVWTDLKVTVEELLKNKKILEMLSSKARFLSRPDATRELARRITDIIKNKRANG